MSLPTYETTVGGTSGGTTDNPPAYVQPAAPVYFIQASPPAHNGVSSAQLQQIMTVPAAIQPQSPTKYFETFLKGKPKALGIVIIIAAIVQIILGIAHGFTQPYFATFFSGIMFWGPVIYIIAGSLTIAAQKKPNTCLIRGSLGMNIVSALVSASGVIPVIIDIVLLQSPECSYTYGYYYGYNYGSHDYICNYYKHDGPLAIVCIVLITEVLIFCISVSTSAFGCRSLKHVPVVQQVYVIQNGLMLTMPPSTPPAMFLQQPAFPSVIVPPGAPTK